MALADALPSGPSLVQRTFPGRRITAFRHSWLPPEIRPHPPQRRPIGERSKICPNDGSQHPAGIRSGAPTATADPERTFAIPAVGREGETLRCRRRILPENAEGWSSGEEHIWRLHPTPIRIRIRPLTILG